MNSPVTNTENVVLAKTKAPRAPTLSAKYSKFLAFGFWMTSQMVEKSVLSEEQRDAIFENLAIYQSIDEQAAFYEDFLKTSCGPATKAIKKLVAAKNKPPKAPRAPKKVAAGEKKTKAVKKDDLIAQLIADANGEAVPTSEVVVPTSEVVVAPKKSKKSKKTQEAEVVTEDVATPVAPEPVAPKKKAAASKKSKKTDEVAEVAPESVAPESVAPKKKAATKKSKATVEEQAVDVAPVEAVPKKSAAPKKSKKTEPEPVAAPAGDANEDIIQTRVVTIADKEYLIDSQNNLYNIEEPHDQVGNYEPESGNVTFL